MLTQKADRTDIRESMEWLGYWKDHPERAQIVDALVAVFLTLDHSDLRPEMYDVVFRFVTPEGQGALNMTKEYLDRSWQDFDYGNVKIGDYVRVKKDAYPDGTGARHNGLVGKLIDMRAGKCRVQYIGLAVENEMNHPKENLESLKWV